MREVKPDRSDPFWATDIAAIFGSADDVQRTRFDCRVVGTEAQRVIAEMKPHVDAEKKVLAAFKLGDLYAETFTYQKGDKAGTTGVSLKARLLRIDWVKVDGETVYTAPAPEAQTAPRNPPASHRRRRIPPVRTICRMPPADEASEGQDSGEDIADDLPDEVALSLDDADFAQKKARLKAEGYRFDGQYQDLEAAAGGLTLHLVGALRCSGFSQPCRDHASRQGAA